MKKSILIIALFVSVLGSLTSCMTTQEGRGRGRHEHRGRSDRHHGPYDSNYSRYHRN